MRISLLAATLLAAALLAACADPAAREFDSPAELNRAIDHDIAASLPSADRNLRAVPPGRPTPVENGWGAVRF